MTTIQGMLQETLDNYLFQKATLVKAKKTVPLYSTVVNQLPKHFADYGGLSNDIKVQGSIGKGVITDTPWICFFDREITTSAQHGYYVAILFREDMKGFCLSLNQGWTQYSKSFGTKKGRQEIELNSKKAATVLRSLKDFESSPLDLHASRALGKGYELGNIYSRYYPTNQIPEDKVLISDLQQLLGAYRELKGIVGDNILNIRTLSSEEDFQAEVQTSNKVEIPAGPVQRPDLKLKSSSTNWARNPKVSSSALDYANYSCEFDNTHYTFTSKMSGKQFLEAHHLVPMEKQSDFNFSLDVPENIIGLCPNCHRRIHLGSKQEKDPMLDAFLEQRKVKLASRGILVNLEQLRNIYKQLD